MRFILPLLTLLVLTMSSPETHHSFMKLVDSLKHDEDVDIDELMTMEDKYEKALTKHKDDVLYSDVELLTADEELSDEPTDEDEINDDSYEDISNFPERLDWRDYNVVHRAIQQGFTCGSCGWVSGTQTLEARIAIKSENYIPYSIQNFMDCTGKICIGTLPYSITTQARKSDFIVSEAEIPYTQRKCMYEGEVKSKVHCYEKCGELHPLNFNNTLHEQFVVIVGTGSAQSEDLLIKALQEGPVTTCFNKNKPPGERCSPGCAHANSIIGYTIDSFILQNSYGKSWGPFNNGSWLVPKESLCAKGIINKAYHPRIFYDYDRANAFYNELKGVDEKELTFVDKTDYGIEINDTRNWGTSKNKCAFLGSACKGVVELSSGKYELISDFGESSSGSQRAFKKTQMVVYIRHENSGNYIGIENKGNQLGLISVEKNKAAPFYTSYGRFISFEYPKFHIVNTTLQPIIGTLREIALNFDLNLNITNDHWHLSHCNIHNTASGNSLDLLYQEIGKRGKITSISLKTAALDKSLQSQRFNIGISRKWNLISEETGSTLSSTKKFGLLFGPEKYLESPVTFLWQTRQIMNQGGGNSLGSDGIFYPLDYKNTTNVWNPTDCSITKTDDKGQNHHLALENGELIMIGDEEKKQGWTFDYGDL